jgi:hypothetical protein
MTTVKREVFTVHDMRAYKGKDVQLLSFNLLAPEFDI